MINNSEQMTPRESLEHEWYVEEQRMAREHAVLMKRLEIEEQKLEAKWASWMKIPITIVKLPVYIVMAIGAAVAVARKQPPEKFLDYLK